jgi:hypothetical protein
MDLKNASEFEKYCQEHILDGNLPKSLHLAERIADDSLELATQSGGQEEEMDKWIDEAYRNMIGDREIVDQETLVQAHEVLSRFWIHGAAFDEWFRAKVIIIQ